MAHFFAALDGDNAGNHVGQAVLHDDVEALADISQKIEAANQAVKQWVESHGGKMISFGGDESTFIIEAESLEALGDMIEELRQQYLQTSGFTVTAGIGESLSQAGKALMAGKLAGKDIVMEYGDHVESVLQEAHSHAMAGEGTEEEEKLDEAYLGDLMGDDDGAEVEDEHFDQEDADLESEPESIDQEQIEPGYAHQEDGEDEESDLEDVDQEEEFHDHSEQPAEMLDDSTQEPSQEDGDDDILEGLPEDSEMFEGDAGERPPIASEPDDSPESYMMAPEDVDQDLENEAPDEDQGEPGLSDFESEQPIKISGAVDSEHEEPRMDEELSTEEEAKADEGAGSPEDAGTETSPELDAFGQLIDEGVQEDDAALKARIAEALAKFKDQKEVLQAAAAQAPQLYEASLEMLKVMIDMARKLFPPSSIDVPSGVKPAQEEVPQDPKT